ncbi:MAG TPA: Gfo/Idh/MocA family oxidoreductase [Anaerohalosphaeraceae bacterium]|nr:Gfo/Idh/MocA family oxidoreductase [Phycisphaerae bacterium]HOK95739.1 Gfo/Idh/MocA family oxidoreductase [Anaerohalosphaeraceae bacterium]HOL31140.1 Gfo/Idh/MocA family oxidoreductase [Anaerohalosphaeraceae bacterium]HOM76487.1 Gfo/Idh/MocA family oxidoreductase [Anaerohalosphaeraceae bacterium]HPC64625.1 Gfo/Idh/MocA family oxidoreductase [Anaerohalosphaeraceae bacterium]
MKRRDFLKQTAFAAGGLFGFPTIVKPSVFAAETKPNDKINIGQIGFGRIARGHDLPETIKHDMCRIVAVADVDSKRARDGKRWIESYYARKTGQPGYVDVKVYGDYREMLADSSIDAVIISTPDHWHAQPAMEAALAGKHIYLQKPASLTIAEGRQMSDVVRRSGCVFQIGSQQRSRSPWPQFKRVCQLVRNGRIGQIKHVQIGLPTDPGCGQEPEMPVPENLNYDMWLGSTPTVYYTEKRVHPQNSYDRPGWLRCEQFGAGMITGWGAHHFDTAHWGMDAELTGPVEVEGQAEFPASGLWDVHGDFDVQARYANGITMHISSKFPNGVRFEGSEGWIFVARGAERVTASDPVSGDPNTAPVLVSDAKLLEPSDKPDAVELYDSPEQHLNWLECIRSRKETVAPVEVAHRSCSVCLVSHIAMKLRRKLRWDPVKEQFIDDAQANAMLSRPQRKPYGTNYVKA